MATYDKPVVASTSWHCTTNDAIQKSLRWTKDGVDHFENTSPSDLLVKLIHPDINDDSLIEPCSITVVSYYGIKDITIVSESRTVEFYLDKMIYQSTARGTKVDIRADACNIYPMYEVCQSFPEPCPFLCTLKCLSLPNKKELQLHEITITLAGNSVSPNYIGKEGLNKPKIDMQRVQSIISSIGGPKADKVGQLLSSVQSNEKKSGGSDLMRLFLNQLPTLRQENKPEKSIEVQQPIGLDTSQTETNALLAGINNEDGKFQIDQGQVIHNDIKKDINLSLIHEYIDKTIKESTEKIIKAVNDKVEMNNKLITNKLDQITRQLELITCNQKNNDLNEILNPTSEQNETST